MNLKPTYFGYILLHYKSPQNLVAYNNGFLFLIRWIDWEVLLVSPGLTGAAAGRGSQLKLEHPKGFTQLPTGLAVGWRAFVLLHMTSHAPGR